VCTVASATFEEDNGFSLRSITVVSVHSWPDGAGLTRVMLEAAAEVVAMGEGEVCICDRGEWMYLEVGERLTRP
jgi:hypothetical protein